jgi:hypothetical protein
MAYAQKLMETVQEQDGYYIRRFHKIDIAQEIALKIQAIVDDIIIEIDDPEDLWHSGILVDEDQEYAQIRVDELLECTSNNERWCKIDTDLKELLQQYKGYDILPGDFK